MVLIAGGLVLKKYLSSRQADQPQALGMKGGDNPKTDDTVEVEQTAPRGLDVVSDTQPEIEIPITSTANVPVVNIPILPVVEEIVPVEPAPVAPVAPVTTTPILPVGPTPAPQNAAPIMITPAPRTANPGLPLTHRANAPPQRTEEGTIDQYHLRTRSSTVHLPEFAENDFHRDEEANNAHFQEQFFPQDVAASVTRKPWQIATESAYNKPREESLAPALTVDDRLDLRGGDITATHRQFNQTQAEILIPREKEKNHQTPEGSDVWTATGEGRGFHPVNRYHQFVLNEDERIELGSGPAGNFAAGAGKSERKADLDNSKQELDIYYKGGADGTNFSHIGGVAPSFELDPSNAESWDLVEHIQVGQRGPVEKNNNNFGNKFDTAHDEDINTFAAKEHSGLVKFKGGLSAANNANSGGEKTFRSAEIDTPVVTGALGGVRLSSMAKPTLDPKKSIESLNQGSAIAFKAGSASKNKASVSKSSHINTEETFSEKESGRTRKGASGNRAVSSIVEMDLNGNKDGINFKPFTSDNLTAPKNNSLPAHLQTAPTFSATNFQDISLKGVDSTVSADSINNAIRGNMVTKTTKQNPIEQEASARDNRLSTIMNDRMSMARQGVSAKLPSVSDMVVSKRAK